METLNYKVLEGTGYNGYILKDAPVKVMQFGEGNFLRAFRALQGIQRCC